MNKNNYNYEWNEFVREMCEFTVIGHDPIVVI